MTASVVAHHTSSSSSSSLPFFLATTHPSANALWRQDGDSTGSERRGIHGKLQWKVVKSLLARVKNRPV